MNPYHPPEPIESEHHDEGLGILLDAMTFVVSTGALIGAALLVHFARG